MKRKFPLSKREENLLEMLWQADKPMTSLEILAAPNQSWGDTYVKAMLRTLLNSGVLKVTGVEIQGTNNLRLYEPAFTREEYAAKIAASRVTKKSQVGAIVAAFAKETATDDEELIKRLEDIIEELRKEK